MMTFFAVLHLWSYQDLLNQSPRASLGFRGFLAAMALLPLLVYTLFRAVDWLVTQKRPAFRDLGNLAGLMGAVMLHLLALSGALLRPTKVTALLAFMLLFFAFNLRISPDRYDDQQMLSIYGQERREMLFSLAYGFAGAGLLVGASGYLLKGGIIRIAGMTLSLLGPPALGLALGLRLRAPRRNGSR